MIGAAPTSPRTGVPGWLTDGEETLLAELAAQLAADEVFVGIGVEYGRSMSVIAHSSPSKHIYGVELKPQPGYEANMKEAGLSGRTTILVGDSADVAEQWDGSEIAILFVDGAHEYHAVLADLTNWTPFVKLGGVVALHDVACETNKLPHALHYEVKRALDEWRAQNLDDWMFIRSVDSMVVLERVGKEDALPYFENGEGWVDKPPVEPEPETWDDLDAEIHTEPAPKPKAKGRPRKSSK
jgi:predicted O-methyltransferase YrrM